MPEHPFPRQEYKVLRLFEIDLGPGGAHRQTGQFHPEGVNEARTMEEWINKTAVEGWVLHSITPMQLQPSVEPGYILVFRAK
jgi:hypothetical protein